MNSPQQPSVAIYARISSDRTGQKAGVNRQLDDCRAIAAVHRLNVVAEIVENDTSAYRTTRKGFERLKKMAMSGVISAVVAFDSDRLYRSIGDLESMITVVEKAPEGFQILSVQNGEINLNTAGGRAMARVLAGLAQYEVEQKAQRQARAHKDAWKQGRWSGGKVPIGYKVGNAAGELLVDEPMAAILRQTADLVLYRGYKINAATKYFRETSGRLHTRPISLRGVLTGPTVAGMREYLPETAKRRGVTKGTPRKANWAPIFDHATWTALKKELKTTPLGRPPTPSLLSGFLLCGICETTLGYSKASYKCSTNSGGCGGLSISTRAIEKHFLSIFDFDEGDNAPLILNLLGGGQKQVQPVTDVSAELDELQNERQQLLYFLQKKSVKAVDVDARLDEIAARETELEDQQGEALAANLKVQQVESVRAEWAKLTDSVEDTAKKNFVIRGMFKACLVNPVGKGGAGPKLDVNRLHLLAHDLDSDDEELEDWEVDQYDDDDDDDEQEDDGDTRLTNDAFDFDDDDAILRGDVLMT
ncbi:recombinase family protein [Arthrobacter sp. UYEF21]|uniref:recombinase family protein n=1 Tax=Arthrobacter sp. UYEF21 TaxID=1756364 RepID=UPI00339AD2B2